MTIIPFGVLSVKGQIIGMSCYRSRGKKDTGVFMTVAEQTSRHMHTLFLSHTLSLSLSLSLSRTHTRARVHTHSFLATHTHTMYAKEPSSVAETLQDGG